MQVLESILVVEHWASKYVCNYIWLLSGPNHSFETSMTVRGEGWFSSSRFCCLAFLLERQHPITCWEVLFYSLHVSPIELLGAGRSFKGWYPVDKVRSLWCVLKSSPLPPFLSLSVCFLHARWLPHPPCCDVCLDISPRALWAAAETSSCNHEPKVAFPPGKVIDSDTDLKLTKAFRKAEKWRGREGERREEKDRKEGDGKKWVEGKGRTGKGKKQCYIWDKYQ